MIKIELTGAGKYQATVHVREDINARDGCATPDGPWVLGLGATPDEALRDMYEQIGRLYAMSLGR